MPVTNQTHLVTDTLERSMMKSYLNDDLSQIENVEKNIKSKNLVLNIFESFKSSTV